MNFKKMQETNISSTPTVNDTIDQAQFEADKRAVYKHPLFSLLALLLEKCEQATQGYITSSSSSNGIPLSPNRSRNSTPEGISFSKDMQAFVQLLEKEKRPLLTNNAELDGLMIKALQVLRIHLLELEKVQELCRDFCTRYIACLRGKMQSENLLRSDYPLETNNNISNSNSPINSPDQEQITNQSNYFATSDFMNTSSEANELNTVVPGAFNLLQTNNNAVAESNYNSNSSEINDNGISSLNESVYSSHQNQPIQSAITSQVTNPNEISSSLVLGSTPLSQIGCLPLPLDQYSGQLSPCGSSDEVDSEVDSNNDELSSNLSNTSASKRQKRGILPKQATSVMRAWLFQHLVHPYPNEDEKRSIAAQTNLTLLQVNNWFINARRRILQPMLEHANDNSSNQSRKKGSHNSSSNNSTTKRFWPDNIIGQNLIDSTNIENISANVNSADIDRISSNQKIEDNFFSSDESNSSLVIDHDC